MRKVIELPHDIFRFDVALCALSDGVSLEEISQTAMYQLATCIVAETMLLANGDKRLASLLLQIDEVTLEGWMLPASCVVR